MVATSGKIASPIVPGRHFVFLALRRAIPLSVLPLIWVPPLEVALIDPRL